MQGLLDLFEKFKLNPPRELAHYHRRETETPSPPMPTHYRGQKRRGASEREVVVGAHKPRKRHTGAVFPASQPPEGTTTTVQVQGSGKREGRQNGAWEGEGEVGKQKGHERQGWRRKE